MSERHPCPRPSPAPRTPALPGPASGGGLLAVLLLAGSLPGLAEAVEPHRSWYELPSSNGWGGVVVDLQRARPHHWRDHLFATEEPVLDSAGAEVWVNDQPRSVHARDLLLDAYFGLRVDDQASWLPDEAVDLDASGWAAPDEPGVGGTNLVRIVQTAAGLEATTWVWAPWDLPRSAMALVLELHNPGATPLPVQAFGLLNLHLGEGRPEPDQEIGAQNETVVVHSAGRIEERGFAGVVASHALGGPPTAQVWWPGNPAANPYDIVPGGGDLLAGSGDQGVHEDSVPYLQWDLGVLPPGGSTAVGVILAHHGDPFAYDGLAAEVEAWIAGRSAAQLLTAERAGWADFQAGLAVPTGLSTDEAALYRHSAAVLRMAQVRETHSYAREHLERDGDPRHSSFGAVPGLLQHDGAGAVLASLPPGRWTYAWPRDGAYAIAGMAAAGMHAEARDALSFLMNARTDRYRGWTELAALPLVPYAISLCRHHGFGDEESDTLGGGDINVEFDGAGLFLWALGEYVRASGDSGFVDENWAALRDEVAGFLVPLVDEQLGLIAADSSIWETHWFGKERRWAYTSITAARGLCEAATLAETRGEAALATEWRGVAERLRQGILDSLVDGRGLVASNLLERQGGAGYADAAVIEAVSMGLVDPAGTVTSGTIDGLLDALQTPDGPGVSRNDDEWDEHALSPWGSGYDSAEWVIMDLRLSEAARLAGRTDLADSLLDWVTAQSTANYGAIGETYDRITGDYTNNAPMVGFGPGAWIHAVHQRQGLLSVGPACGAYPIDPPLGDDDDTVEPGDDDDGDDDTAAADDDSAGDDDAGAGDDDGARTRFGCECGDGAAGLAPLALLPLGIRRRRSQLR